MTDRRLEQIVGGNPIAVAVRLLILCFLVGLVLSALNFTPEAIVRFVVTLVERIWNLGIDAIYNAGEYLILGAVVVIPIWILGRIFSKRRG